MSTFTPYLESVEFVQPQLDTATVLTQAVNVYIGIDGVAVPGLGSVGWVISTDTGNILVRGSGFADGFDPRFYRTEIISLNVAARFVLCLHQFHFPQTTLNASIKFVSDSESTVKKLKLMQAYRTAPR